MTRVDKPNNKVSSFFLILAALCAAPAMVMLIVPDVLPHGNNGLGFIFLAMLGTPFFIFLAFVSGVISFLLGIASPTSKKSDSPEEESTTKTYKSRKKSEREEPTPDTDETYKPYDPPFHPDDLHDR